MRCGSGPPPPLTVTLFYLSERELDTDGQTLLIQNLKDKLNLPGAEVTLQRIATAAGTLEFEIDQTEISPERPPLLERVGQLLQQHPNLEVNLTARLEALERPTLAQQRVAAIKTYLQDQWGILPQRLTLVQTQSLPGNQSPQIAFQLNLNPQRR